MNPGTHLECISAFPFDFRYTDIKTDAPSARLLVGRELNGASDVVHIQRPGLLL